MKHQTAAATSILALTLAAGQARAEPNDQFSSVDTEIMLSDPDLPGRPRGERRPEPAKPTDTKLTEPAPVALREWFGGKPIWEWSRLTGDWGGLRTDLENAGLTLAASYTLDWQSVWDGGINRRAGTHSLLDINLTADLDKLLGLAGGTVYLDFMSTRGNTDVTADAGSFNLVNVLSTTQSVDQLAELWYQQKFFDDKLRVKLGKIEANAEFAFVNAAGDFLSASAYMPQSIYLMPTYPNPAMGAVVFVYPVEWLYLGGGFFDGSLAKGQNTGAAGPKLLFEGNEYFWIGEAGVTWKECLGLADGRVALGGWTNTHRFTAFDGSQDRGVSGFFGLFEQRLLKRGDLEARGLYAFIQGGVTEESIAAPSAQIAAGLVFQGTLPGRDDDGFGLLYSWTDLSDDPNATFPRDEHVFEVYYKVQLTPAISLTPDIQVIANPNGSATTQTAVVGGLRLSVTF